MLDIGSILFRWLFQCRFCDLLMGSGRDSTPFFVPHTVLLKNSHVADWIFTSHGDGSIKHKFKTHISSSTIFEEFNRRSATESHHGVVAVFHKAAGGSVCVASFLMCRLFVFNFAGQVHGPLRARSVFESHES